MNQTSGRIGIEVRTVLTVRLGRTLHAIPISAIVEILPSLPIEPIAGSHSSILGVVSVRGHLIPVVNTAARLQLPEEDCDPDPHLVCVRVDDRLMALQVDEAIDLVDVSGASYRDLSDVAPTNSLLLAVVDYQGKMLRIINPQMLASIEVEAPGEQWDSQSGLRFANTPSHENSLET